MTQNQFNGVIRALVPALLAYFVGKGWVTESSVGDISAAIVTIGAAGWSIISNVENPAPKK